MKFTTQFNGLADERVSSSPIRRSGCSAVRSTAGTRLTRGGATVILAATYPDVFATATAVAGGEYGLNQVDPDDPAPRRRSTPPVRRGPRWATGRGRCRRQSYLVHDMGHAWPGPAGDGLFTDRAGPDANAIIWDFAHRHPKGSPA